jgi:two-component system sensor histidine kinase DctS
MAAADLAPPDLPAPLAHRLRRALPWGLLVALLFVAQTLLVVLTIDYEGARAQERAEAMAAEAGTEVKREVTGGMQALQTLQWNPSAGGRWAAEAGALLSRRRAMLRVEHRSSTGEVLDAVDSPYRTPLFSVMPRHQMGIESDLACSSARRTMTPRFSRSYFVPQPGGLGLEIMDVCIPLSVAGSDSGYLVGTYSLPGLLEEALTPRRAGAYELTFIEGDGTRLARAGLQRGAGVYRSQRAVDLAGTNLTLRADSVEVPRFLPNLSAALVMGLSLALFAVVVLLWRDVRRRAKAEGALAEALAFRKAMEDSLITGLRARDLDGRITYVNPAFCHMVGFSADELLQANPPPYWPAERVAEYSARQSMRLSSPGGGNQSRQGFETVFTRKSGERIQVMIFEAPLVDREGQHTGWMSAVLDMTEQRRVEELSRQQQDRLQATARLATVGEMASLLSHELNQPLAAIASYATGSINLMADADAQTLDMVRGAMLRIAEQAERAGRVIKSVHGFVRRREQAREVLRVDHLIESVLPLVRLQARKSGARIEVEVEQPPARVLCDRTMVEQVLLNLTRNGLQAMEGDALPLERRVLRIEARANGPRWARFTVTDAGTGIAPEVAAQLFTPFFTTRSEGMGLGLSLCRTVIEQHGGALDFQNHADGGASFHFTLPGPNNSTAAASPSTDLQTSA